jgi:hypothetical protein
MELSKDEIDILKQYQKEGRFHPYTCCSYKGCKRGVENNWGELIPTEDKWVCPCSKYKQEYDGSETNMIELTKKPRQF